MDAQALVGLLEEARASRRRWRLAAVALALALAATAAYLPVARQKGRDEVYRRNFEADVLRSLGQ